MSDDANNLPITNTDQPNTTVERPQPVVFSPEQQAKIDEIVRKAQGRAAAETRQQLENERQERARLDAELKAAQESLTATATERDSEKSARLSLEQQAIKWRKDAFIAAKCIDHALIDVSTVNALTERNLAWNEHNQSFDVVNDQGTVQAITPEEFFAEFATKRPYLVKSSIRLGTGSENSSRTNLSTGRQVYKVEDIFGPKSNSRLANELAQRSPDEYKRLKAEARGQRLV